MATSGSPLSADFDAEAATRVGLPLLARSAHFVVGVVSSAEQAVGVTGLMLSLRSAESRSRGGLALVGAEAGDEIVQRLIRDARLAGEDMPLRGLHRISCQATAGHQDARQAILRHRIARLGGAFGPLRGTDLVLAEAGSVEQPDG